MLENRSREATCPPEVLALIPWYPDGALSSAERGAVEAHAATCPACRDEIHALLGELEPEQTVEAPPAARVLARVLDRIEREEAGRHPRPAAAPPRPAPAARRAGRGRLSIAAGLALAAGLGALAALTVPSFLGNSTYRTAVSPESLQADGPLIEMIPREEVSAAELRAALRRIEGEVIAGPLGMHGRYRVRLPAGADPAAAAASLKSEDGGIATYAEALQL